MRVIIAAAGTAGHINPGLAIANKIKEEEKDSKIIFIGTTRGLENDLVPRAGYELKTIDAYGLSKKISIENIKKMYKTLKGYGEAKKIIKEFKPDIVIGTGGYICGATISAAHSLKIPTLLHESNAFPGKAVKMLANKTDTILVSFEDARSRIKNAKNIVYTGTPVKIRKKDYGINEKNSIIKSAGLNETKPIVLIFGGSQGAQKINDAILGILKNKLNNTDTNKKLRSVASEPEFVSALQEYNAAFTSAKHRLDGDEIQMLQAFAVSAKAVWVLQAVRELKAANRGKVIRNPKNYLTW